MSYTDPHYLLGKAVLESIEGVCDQYNSEGCPLEDRPISFIDEFNEHVTLATATIVPDRFELIKVTSVVPSNSSDKFLVKGAMSFFDRETSMGLLSNGIIVVWEISLDGIPHVTEIAPLEYGKRKREPINAWFNNRKEVYA